MPKRVLLAGLFHETHTFLDSLTTLEDFSLRRGAELLETAGDGSPLAGAVETGREAGWQILPLVDYRATPSATVEDRVVEQFWDEFQTAAQPELERGVDGIFLILHGAMVSQSIADVEGELLRRIRRLPGAKDLPLGGVLDLHANCTAEMAQLSDALVAYRENPHTDAHAAAVRAAQLFDRILTSGQRPCTVWEHPPLMWPPTGTATAAEPMRDLEALARTIEHEHPEILAVNVLSGFSFADTPETGVSFTAVTLGNPDDARRELGRLSRLALDNRAIGNATDLPIADVMPCLPQHAEGPVILVEPSDNIGGGAPGDGTGVLRALVEHEVDRAAVAICDPLAVTAAVKAGVGACLTLALGGKGSLLDRGPLSLQVEVISLSDGRFELEDRHSHLASMCGTQIDMGPSAVVRHRGILILLNSRKTPPFDLGQWRSQGIDPESLQVIGVKAAVAHRRAYDPISRASYTVDTPGPCSSNLRSFPFRKIRRPIYPLDE
jgi:microcystin degradation protein MlrC